MASDSAGRSLGRGATIVRKPGSGGFDDPAGLNAVGAHQHLLGLTVANRPDTLQVGVETAFVHVVGMTHMISHHRFFTANFTYLCHCSAPLRKLRYGVSKKQGGCHTTTMRKIKEA
jgi:hypothetical protein